MPKRKLQLDRIYNMDCMDGMKMIPEGSVDCIICDLPYGTTHCKWDVIIPFDKLWEQYNRIIKDNGAIVLFGQEPFSSCLRMSNLKMYKYDWVWNKNRGANFMMAKYVPLKITENIIVFSKGGINQGTHNKMVYNPQGLVDFNKLVKHNIPKSGIHRYNCLNNETLQTVTNYPKNILEFKTENGLHPTQKPVALIAYLIRTYSNEGDIILDNCMGSGTTAIAAIREKRHFIGFECDRDYFGKAVKRIEDEKKGV